MSEPISESLLVHSATLKPKTGENDYGKPTYGTDVALSKVRVSRVRYNPVNSMGESVNDRLILNFDCTFSQPAGTTFKEGDGITYGTVTYNVREVGFPSGDASGVHHYRLVLSGV